MCADLGNSEEQIHQALQHKIWLRCAPDIVEITTGSAVVPGIVVNAVRTDLAICKTAFSSDRIIEVLLIDKRQDLCKSVSQ